MEYTEGALLLFLLLFLLLLFLLAHLLASQHRGAFRLGTALLLDESPVRDVAAVENPGD